METPQEHVHTLPKKKLHRINKQDEEGRTQLHRAVINSQCCILRLLIQMRANVNIRDNYGMLALDYAPDVLFRQILQRATYGEASVMNYKTISGETYGLIQAKLKNLEIAVSGAKKREYELQRSITDLRIEYNNFRMKALQTQAESEDCVICLDEPRLYAYTNCGHRILCETCNKKAPRQCPVCKVESDKTIKIYC